MSRLRISDEERRRRLGARHALASPAAGPVEAAERVVALHSSDPLTPFLSTWARVESFRPADLEVILYDRMDLVRLHAMRRTLWVAAAELAPALTAAAGLTVAGRERARTIKLFSGHIDGDGQAWLDRHLERAEATVAARPGVTTSEVGEVLPRIRATLAGAPGATTPLVSRLLLILGMEGRIQRHRPRGTWVSSQYRWVPATFEVAPDPTAARALLIDRWLVAFGPGTLTDITWWTGWGKRMVLSALEQIGAEEVETEGGVGYVGAGDTGETPESEPWVALLPGLDPTVMGWKERDWYLPAGAGELFDRHGNAGPTVWADGRIVGGWGQRRDGAIAVEMVVDVDRATAKQIGRQAERLRQWLGELRVTPRFPAPVSRRLMADAVDDPG